MESSPHSGDKSTLDDEEGLVNVGMGSIAKRPCTVVLEEKIEDNFQPTEEELLEYALWLGMNIPRDMDLIWIARDGLTQPLPDEWKPCQTDDDEIYYFNFETGESVWDHPCDGLYRKLYQEECKKLGKRPYQIRENSSCSSNLQQQISNWGEASTYLQPSHQVNYNEMLNEKEKHPLGEPPLQDDIGLGRFPSNKEIQMNIVEKEIDSLKGIRDQLLQKMNEALWQGEQFSTLGNQLAVDRVAKFNEEEQNNGSLLEGLNHEIPSVEVEHFTELNKQRCGQNWNNIQLDEEEDPRKTKERTEMLRKQLEMAKMIPPQLANRVGGEHINDSKQMYKDHQRYENQINRGPPTKYASKVSQEANGKHSFLSDGRDVIYTTVMEELKKEELHIVEEMKERILMQVRTSMEVLERSAFEEYELMLTRKKNKLELLRKELRKDMEFELLLEEELILKRKKEELSARLHNQVERDSFVAHEACKVTKCTQLVNGIEDKLFLPKDEKLLENLRIETSLDSIRSNNEALATTMPVAPDYDFFTKMREVQRKGKEALQHKSVCDENAMYEDEKKAILDIHGVSSHSNSARNGPEQNMDVDEGLKELFLQHRRELRDDIISLQNKMNEILVLHAKADQLNLEMPSILSTIGMEDNCKASHDAKVEDANATQLLYTLQRSIGELDANLKHLEERKVGLDSKNNANMKDLKQYKPPTQNDEKMNGHHPGGDISTDTLLMLKEFLVVVDKELEQNTNHCDEDVIKTSKSKYILPNKEDEALDMKTNDRMSAQTSLILKRLIEKIENHVEHQTTQKEGRSRDKTDDCGPSMKEIPVPKYGHESLFLSLKEDLCKRIFDVHGIVTQFEAISTDMISSLKGFTGQLDGKMKERTQPSRMEIKCEVNGSRRHNESTRYGYGIVKDQQTLQNCDVDHANDTSKVTSGETMHFEKLPVDALGTLEQFIGTLHYKLKDHISNQDSKACKDIHSLQMDSKQDTNFQLHEASLQEVKHIFADDICGTSAIPGVSVSGLSTTALCNSKGFVDGLHEGILTSSIQQEKNSMEDKVFSFPIRSTKEDDNFLLLLEKNPDIQSVLPKIDWEETQDDPISELDKISTKSLYAFEKFQNEVDKDLHNQVLPGTREPELDATKFKSGKMDDICASSPEGTSIDAGGISTSLEKIKKPLDAHSISYDIMCIGLKGFIAEVDEELKAIIQNCKRKLKNENGTMGSAMKDNEHHEFYSHTEETELESQSFIPLLKAWSTQIEKSTRHLLHCFKSELMEEMNTLQQKRADEPSTLRSIHCDELQPPKPQHLTQVQTQVAEERSIWYDILNDATKQWLQKEWVERLEHQSDLATTCDNSVSEPNSESLSQAQQVLGKEKKTVHDILNHSTQKWLVHQRDPSGSHGTSVVKQSAQEATESLNKDSFKIGYSPCATSRQKYCTPNTPHARNDFAKNTINGRSHMTDVIQLEEGRQSNLFTNNLEVMGHRSGNFNFGVIQSSCSGKEDGNNCGYDVDQKAKLFHDISVSQNSLSSINRWISKADSFGAFNDVNEVGELQERGLCGECQTQNIIMHGVKREAHGHDTRGIQVPRTISQLKLVSKRSWQNLQSKLRVAQATRWAHMIGSWAIEQMSCGLPLKKDCSYPAFAIKKSIKAIMEKTLICGKAHLEDFEGEIHRDDKKGSASDDPRDRARDNTIQKYYNYYPSIKPCLTRPTSTKTENYRNNNISPVDLQSFHKQNSSIAYGEVTHDFSGGRRFDASANMDGRHEQWKDPEKLHSAESIENSFVKYQSDDDLALSNVETEQCDCQTPMTSSINLKEVDMHELEEAIDNLRKSRELEARGKLLWVNHSQHRGDNHYEDEQKDHDICTPSTYQREIDNINKPFDFENQDQDVNQESSNTSKYKQTKNGHMQEVPKFITFEILQQGEIGCAESNISGT